MAFSEELIEQVWNKGRIISGYDENLVRKDCCGAWIVRDRYGDRNDDFGWEIDHVYPESKGGDDNIENLRPMQWKNNESKNDDYPSYASAVKADGNSNVECQDRHTVNSVLQNKIQEIYKNEVESNKNF